MTTEDTTHVRLLIEIKREIEAVHSQCVEINQMVRQLDERLLVVEEKLAAIDTRRKNRKFRQLKGGLQHGDNRRRRPHEPDP